MTSQTKPTKHLSLYDWKNLPFETRLHGDQSPESKADLDKAFVRREKCRNELERAADHYDECAERYHGIG